MPNIPILKLPSDYKPSLQEAEKYFRVWNSLPNYKAHEEALSFLFREEDSPFVKNDNLKSIIIKASALNDFYSTNIYRIYDIANKIVSIEDFDSRLQEGELDLVDDFRKICYKYYKQVEKDNRIDVKKEVKCIDHYSFATKYCSHHQPEKFPIFDSYVEKVLLGLRSMYPDIFNFKNNDLRTYKKYAQILDTLKNHFGLMSLSYKSLDRYLWQLGKRYYSPYIDTVNGKIDYDI